MGLRSNGDLDADSTGIGPKLAMAVGGGWVAATLWMQATRRPLQRGLQDLKELPYHSPRDQLAAEHLAEEHIDEAARFCRKLKWMSVTTNLAASAYALSDAENGMTGESVGYLGTVGALLPLLFPYRAKQVSEDQRSYKKKVFGPVSFGNGLIVDPFRRSLFPGRAS